MLEVNTVVTDTSAGCYHCGGLLFCPPTVMPTGSLVPMLGLLLQSLRLGGLLSWLLTPILQIITLGIDTSAEGYYCKIIQCIALHWSQAGTVNSYWLCIYSISQK